MGCDFLNSVNVEVFPASNGDCFLVSLGKTNPKYILIDGGISDTYHDFLKKRLLEISENGGELALLVVTHIDDDHIGGINELFKENGSNEEANIIRIREVWHNSYRHFNFSDLVSERVNQDEKSILESIIKIAPLSNKHTQDKPISAKQGSTLSAMLYSGNYNWNTSFNNQGVYTENKNMIELDDGVIFRLLSPDITKLEKLKNLWFKELNSKKIGFKFTKEQIFDDAYEMYFRNYKHNIDINENNNISASKKTFDLESLAVSTNEVDKSPTNGSSIAFIIEYGEKKLLFLGDAHPDLICSNLKNLRDTENYKMNFDFVKIPHHGSYKNNTIELFQLLQGRMYLFSTNGKKHSHPNFVTLARLVMQGNPETLIFNYITKSAQLLEEYFTTTEMPNCNVEIHEGTASILLEI